MRRLRRATIHQYITLQKAAGVGPATINRELDDMSAAINWYNFLHELNLPMPLSTWGGPYPKAEQDGSSGRKRNE
ncbi:hypothetical protein D3C85_1720030 [compost metagenome]